MRLTTAIVFLCLIAFPAEAFQIDCNLVRQYVAEHGTAKALAFALSQGATWRQIQDARKCLKN